MRARTSGNKIPPSAVFHEQFIESEMPENCQYVLYLQSVCQIIVLSTCIIAMMAKLRYTNNCIIETSLKFILKHYTPEQAGNL